MAFHTLSSPYRSGEVVAVDDETCEVELRFERYGDAEVLPWEDDLRVSTRAPE
jgi:hypothetical protein